MGEQSCHVPTRNAEVSFDSIENLKCINGRDVINKHKLLYRKNCEASVAPQKPNEHFYSYLFTH